MKNFLGLLIVCVSLSAPAAGFAAQQQMIVKLKTASLLEEKAEKHLLGGKLLLITADPDELKRDPDVEWAEPNLPIHGTMGGPPPKPEGTYAWGVIQISADKLWIEGRTGKSTIVAVLDSGVATDHPALAKKLLDGWNVLTNTKNSQDDHGHGTHIAGTIAGDKIGVAPGALILPVKVLDKDLGGTVASAIDGIHWSLQHGAKVICSSWVADGFSQGLHDAIAEAADRGVIFVTGAGNAASNNDNVPEYPASYDLPNVVSVAATDQDDRLIDTSNYGQTVHVAAPGYKIYSSVLKGGFALYSGTSMAAAHVAGVAAVMVGQGFKNIRAKLVISGDPKPNLRVQAQGRINAYKAGH